MERSNYDNKNKTQPLTASPSGCPLNPGPGSRWCYLCCRSYGKSSIYSGEIDKLHPVPQKLLFLFVFPCFSYSLVLSLAISNADHLGDVGRCVRTLFYDHPFETRVEYSTLLEYYAIVVFPSRMLYGIGLETLTVDPSRKWSCARTPTHGTHETPCASILLQLVVTWKEEGRVTGQNSTSFIHRFCRGVAPSPPFQQMLRLSSVFTAMVLLGSSPNLTASYSSHMPLGSRKA